MRLLSDIFLSDWYPIVGSSLILRFHQRMLIHLCIFKKFQIYIIDEVQIEGVSIVFGDEFRYCQNDFCRGELKGGEYLINVGDIVDVTEKFGKENNWVVLYLFQPVEMFKDAFPEGK